MMYTLRCIFLILNVYSIVHVNSYRVLSHTDSYNHRYQSLHRSNYHQQQLYCVGSGSKYEDTWSKSNIVGSDTVKQALLTDHQDQLRGLQAKQTIPKNNIIVSVPIVQTLYVDDNCKGKPSSSSSVPCPDKKLQGIWDDIRGTSRLSLLLLSELKKGEKSIFYNYICNLPLKLNTPYHYHDDVVNTIPYAYVVNNIMLQKKSWTSFYNLFKAAGSSIDVSYEQFIWSLEIVRSRAFSGVGAGSSDSSVKSYALLGSSISLVAVAVYLSSTYTNEYIPIGLGTVAIVLGLFNFLRKENRWVALLPVIDSCNHKSVTYNAVMALEEATAGAYVLRSSSDISANDQVTISYGKRDNDDLFQYFGFVESKNPYDTFKVLNPLQTLKKVIEKKGQLAYLLGDIDEILSSASTTSSNAIDNIVFAKDSVNTIDISSSCTTIALFNKIVNDDSNTESSVGNTIDMSVAIKNAVINQCILMLVDDASTNIDEYLKNDTATVVPLIKKLLQEKLCVLDYTTKYSKSRT